MEVACNDSIAIVLIEDDFPAGEDNWDLTLSGPGAQRPG